MTVDMTLCAIHVKTCIPENIVQGLAHMCSANVVLSRDVLVCALVASRDYAVGPQM